MEDRDGGLAATPPIGGVPLYDLMKAASRFIQVMNRGRGDVGRVRGNGNRDGKGGVVSRARIRHCALLVALVALLGGCTFFGQKELDFTNWEPALSPDGTTLAYESPIDGTLELFTRHLETDEVRQLTDNDVEDWSPSWSPDGRRIAFASSRDKNADIYVIDVETLETARLTTHEADDINPDWGVDNRIYFNSNRSGKWEIYSIDPNGQNLLKITETID